MTFVTVDIIGKTEFDLDAMEKLIIARVPALILQRVAKGLDINDRQMAPYSAAYKETLAEMGEGQSVDLRVTGGLLNSVRHTHTDKDANGITVHFAPDAGGSPQVRPPPGGKAKAKRTGKRGPAHNVVGYWLHHGTAKMRPRPWMGLSPIDQKKLGELLRRLRKTRNK